MEKEEIFERKLKREALAREEAERLLEQKAAELFEAREQEKKALKKLYKAQRMEAMGRVSGIIAHDFNNILAGIKGYATLLEDEVTSRTHKKYVEKILSAAGQGEQMVKQISHFGERQNADYEKFEARAIVKKAIDLFAPTLSEDIEIIVDLGKEDVNVEASKVQLLEIMLSALNNSKQAFNAANKDNMQIRVKADMHENYSFDDIPYFVADYFGIEANVKQVSSGRRTFPEHVVSICIYDNANGIEEEAFANIFKPYFAAKKQEDEHTGTGVGMFGAEGIITAHGGGIRYFSKKGFGTICEFVLSTDFTNNEPTIKPQSMDIMVVDDDLVIGNALTMVLDKEGHEVNYFSNPELALQDIQANPTKYNLVITDQMMPEMLGTDLLPQILQINAKMQVVIYSGYAEDLDKSKAVQLGAMDFWTKPIDFEKVKNKINKLSIV